MLRQDKTLLIPLGGKKGNQNESIYICIYKYISVNDKRKKKKNSVRIIPS